MHLLIRTIVYGGSKDEAIENAEQIAENLVEEGVFDYYSATGTWGNYKLGKAYKADSNKGQKLIDDGMKYTKDEFMRSIELIRKNVEMYTDEQLFKLRHDEDMFRHRLWCAGQYKGSVICLYDSDGSGIREPSHLKDALSKWACIYEKAPKPKPNPLKHDTVYVVPFDVHH